ncbi:MAG: putative hydroxymethylpyrimidine transporter CytX [Desulfurococcales archaeon]|nr:putative hydroxymethylpyrimidine transporter CytX [Desulfurococcales archaeon]
MREEYGYSLEPVPSEGRTYSFWHNFAIWFGSDAGVAVFWAGALLTPALSLPTATLLIIAGVTLGNVFMALIAAMGYRTGVPTMVLARGALGVRGSVLPSVLNYVQLIGWSAVMIVVGAKAADQVIVSLTGASTYYLWVVLIGVMLTLWTYLGPEKWKTLETISVAMLLVLTAWLTYITLTRFNISELLGRPGTGGISYWLGLDLVVAMPISWVPLVADYARFSKTLGGSFWGTYIGHFISCALFYFIGALTNVAVGAPDPIAIIASYGLGVPAMLIIIFSTLTTGFLDIYSAAITFKNIMPEASVKKQIVLVGAVSTIIAVFFPVEAYEWFLLLLVSAFVPLAVIMVMDYYARRYDPKELLRTDGRYWYRGGVNVSTMTVWAAAVVFCLLLNIATVLGVDIPVITAIASGYGSSLPTLVLTAALYLPIALLRRKG